MSFFWSTILFSPIFSPDICLFLFFPFIACILDHTSLEEVKQFMDSKNLFQWFCLLCLIVLTDIAFARLYSALFAVLGVRCTFRYALFFVFNSLFAVRVPPWFGWFVWSYINFAYCFFTCKIYGFYNVVCY